MPRAARSRRRWDDSDEEHDDNSGWLDHAARSAGELPLVKLEAASPPQGDDAAAGDGGAFSAHELTNLAHAHGADENIVEVTQVVVLRGRIKDQVLHSRRIPLRAPGFGANDDGWARIVLYPRGRTPGRTHRARSGKWNVSCYVHVEHVSVTPVTISLDVGLLETSRNLLAVDDVLPGKLGGGGGGGLKVGKTSFARVDDLGDVGRNGDIAPAFAVRIAYDALAIVRPETVPRFVFHPPFPPPVAVDAVFMQRASSAMAFVGVSVHGKVFQTHDPLSGRPLIVKVLAPPPFEAVRDDERNADADSFDARVHTSRRKSPAVALRLAAELQHPNVARVVGWGDAGGGRLGIVYVAAGSDSHPWPTLGQLLRAGNHLSAESPAGHWQGRIRIAAGLVAAVKYLLDSGDLFHCDVRPDTLLVDASSAVQLLDCGLGPLFAAKLASPAMFADNGVPGCVGYAAPAYVETGRFSTNAQLYAVGATLASLYTGTVYGLRIEPPRHVDLLTRDARLEEPRGGSLVLRPFNTIIRKLLAAGSLRADVDADTSLDEVLDVLNQVASDLRDVPAPDMDVKLEADDDSDDAVHVPARTDACVECGIKNTPSALCFAQHKLCRECILRRLDQLEQGGIDERLMSDTGLLCCALPSCTESILPSSLAEGLAKAAWKQFLALAQSAWTARQERA